MILMIMMILIPTRNRTRGHSTIERSSVFYSERATTWRVWSWSFVGLTCDANTPIRMGDTCCHNPKEGNTLPVMRVGPNPTSGPDTSVLCAVCCVLRFNGKVNCAECQCAVRVGMRSIIQCAHPETRAHLHKEQRCHTCTMVPGDMARCVVCILRTPY